MNPGIKNNYQNIDSINIIKNDEDFSVNRKDEKINPENPNYQAEPMLTGSGKKNISPRFIFGVLLFLAIGTLVYGFVNLAQNIYKPRSQFNSESSAQNSQIEQSNLISDLLELQSKDTDKDGLSDYDESYIYKTSPYLPDTDSDGYLDKQEIDGGYDPLCPKGQDCRGLNVEPDKGETGGQEIIPPPSEENVLPNELLDELNKLTPDQVRELLRSSGELTEEQIKEIDDEMLMGIYQEVLKGQ